MNSRPRKDGEELALKIRLDLTRFCIETACRRRHNRAIGAYFSDPPNGERLAKEIELLGRALEEIDFGALRRDHQALCGGRSGEILLGQDGSRLILWIDGQIVSPPTK
ncbi:MAG: hypothetical protein JEZ11_23330 [Desulfobacterales bacterium]|nr:hypothetical protein [Desulfobacterales bacterium]